MHDHLPDFVVIGTMKSGTTSLFRWLGEQPGCVLPAVKEPNHFSSDDDSPAARAAYAALFAATPSDSITGEASVAYTDPDRAAMAATRLVATLPDARLVCVVRHPIDRLRSHHRHEVQRGREQRPLADAATGTSPYARWSHYATCIGPWLDAAGERLLVIRFEDLVGEHDDAWRAVLAHVGLPSGPRPRATYNETGSKAAYSPVMRRLYDAGIRRPPAFVPGVVRRTAKRVLLRDRAVDSTGPVAPEVVAAVWDDVAALETRLGRGPLWPRDA